MSNRYAFHSDLKAFGRLFQSRAVNVLYHEAIAQAKAIKARLQKKTV